jgi:hypothetical protein
LKQYLHNENVDFQLVPPGVHRQNTAERAIWTFKNHFIAGLCSIDKDFPLHLCDRILLQTLITLNLLRSSHLNPKLLAGAQLDGTFNFNKTPLSPPGIRVLVHDKRTHYITCPPHVLDGWYTGPALESYQCHKSGFGKPALNACVIPYLGFLPRSTCPLPCQTTSSSPAFTI